MIAFTGLVVSIAVVVVQFAATQYTPRLVAGFRGDPLVKRALGVFVAPTIYALVGMRNIGRHSATDRPQPDCGGRPGVADRRADRVLRAGRPAAGPDAPAAGGGRVVERGGQAIGEAYPFPVGSGPRSAQPAVTPVTATIAPPGPAAGAVGARPRPDRADRPGRRRDRRGRAGHRRGCAHQRAAVLRARPRRAGRCRCTAAGRAAGRGTHDHAGPRVRDPRAGRRRAAGAVAGGQRPDHRRPRARRHRGLADRAGSTGPRTRERSPTQPARCGWCIRRRAGPSCSTSPSPRFACAAPTRRRWRAACARCCSNLADTVPDICRAAVDAQLARLDAAVTRRLCRPRRACPRAPGRPLWGSGALRRSAERPAHVGLRSASTMILPLESATHTLPVSAS